MNINLKSYTLLYAEDEIEIQEEMTEYFRNFFKKVIVTSNGSDALALYKEHKPEVLFLDIYMPGLDGLAVAEQVRKNDYHTKIAIISAYSQDDLMLKAINTSVNYYIIKPSTIKKMKAMLHKISMELARDCNELITLGNELQYCNITYKLYFDNKEIALSTKEEKLLQLLVENRGVEVHIESIIVAVWGEEKYYEISVDSVKSQVSYLRKKLPRDIIKTVYGGGYCLTTY